MRRGIIQRRLVFATVVLVIISLVFGGCGGGTEGTSGARYSIKTASKANIGDYLVDVKGMTLYYSAKDAPGKSNVTGDTLKTWPIFYIANFAFPSSLKKADFANITRDDGQKQTTYKGWPLYYYANDRAPGDTTGQGVDGLWSVINPEKFPPQA